MLKTMRQVLPAFQTRSDRADVLRLGALGTLGDVELNLLVLVQGLVALGLNRRVVHETSSPPSSCAMKPKPFSALNHFTVP